MEDKKINEQESLELITRMIQQTKKDSAIGSGNMFLMWGYLGVFFSLAVVAMTYIRREGGWGWLYMAIPIIGFIAAVIMGRKTRKLNSVPSTYTTKSINSIWGCLSMIFGAYALWCCLNWNEPKCWSGMFLLGMLLPGIGTFCTGIILNEKVLKWCGLLGVSGGILFLHYLCLDQIITLKWPITMAIYMVITLVIPGHVLNHKAKKANK